MLLGRVIGKQAHHIGLLALIAPPGSSTTMLLGGVIGRRAHHIGPPALIAPPRQGAWVSPPSPREVAVSPGLVNGAPPRPEAVSAPDGPAIAHLQRYAVLVSPQHAADTGYRQGPTP